MGERMEAIAQPLAGKSALVTGGARRIGRAIALTLAQAGASVAVTYRSSESEARATAGQIEALGVLSLALPCELRQESSVRQAVQATAAALGGIDILVNNAAVFDQAPFESLSIDAWDAVFETNARGPFLVSREALPWLKAHRGRIVHIGSLGGLRSWPSHAHYCSAKAALHMLTQSMARALAPDVTVNCVAPGWIEFAEDPAEQAARMAARTPMGRNGQPREVADAVLFFAAGPAFVTGQILAVDGGLGL
jgi:NAD(P)-dependent dehydrogenase (short-subunit alcohol dehydrogenase family)